MYICTIMAKEIERKYLVTNSAYREAAVSSTPIRQGYLSRDPARTVRIRLKGDRAYLTVKGFTHGCVRDEWEYPIPVADAREMLDSLADGMVLSKTRYVVPVGDLAWEVDEFHGSLAGLVVAEVELPSADCVIDVLPAFVGREVTGDSRYYNSSLAEGIIPPFG